MKEVAQKIDLIQNKDQIQGATDQLKEILVQSHVQTAKFKQKDQQQSQQLAEFCQQALDKLGEL